MSTAGDRAAMKELLNGLSDGVSAGVPVDLARERGEGIGSPAGDVPPSLDGLE